MEEKVPGPTGMGFGLESCMVLYMYADFTDTIRLYRDQCWLHHGMYFMYAWAPRMSSVSPAWSELDSRVYHNHALHSEHPSAIHLD